MRDLWRALTNDPEEASTPQRVLGVVLLMCLFVMAAASVR